MRKLFYLLLISSLFSGCVQLLPDAPESPSPYLDYMPEKTTEGNNTFGCYEDGKLVAVQGIKQQEGHEWGALISPPLVNAMKRETGDLLFVVEVFPKDDGGIYFYSSNIKQGVNKFEITHKHYVYSGKYYFYEALGYSVDVNITFIDESEHIVCGEFDKIILYNSNNTEETITLTNGQFDVKYGVYKY